MTDLILAILVFVVWAIAGAVTLLIGEKISKASYAILLAVYLFNVAFDIARAAGKL